MSNRREGLVTRGKYKGCTTKVTDGTPTRLLSDREIEEFRAGIERRMEAVAGKTFCPICDTVTPQACAHLRLENFKGEKSP